MHRIIYLSYFKMREYEGEIFFALIRLKRSQYLDIDKIQSCQSGENSPLEIAYWSMIGIGSDRDETNTPEP